MDADGLTRAALDALRADSARWPGRPVFFYGFDEFTRAELDAVETLARVCDVCVALPYEPGRAALAGSASTVELLKPLAFEHVVLEARSEHYAESARGALHALEPREGGEIKQMKAPSPPPTPLPPRGEGRKPRLNASAAPSAPRRAPPRRACRRRPCRSASPSP